MAIMTQKDIREIAESIIEATPEEIVAVKEAIFSLPDGEKFHEAVSRELLNIAREQITSSIGEAFAEIIALAEEEEENEENNTAALIRAQLEEKNLQKLIAKQLQDQKLVQSVREQEAAAMDLSSLIKGQVEAKKLSQLIEEQLHTEDSTDDLATEIIEEIIDEILSARDHVDNEMSLRPRNIELYEVVFKALFDDIVYENELGTIEYKDAYTTEIMLGITAGLVEQGAELTFKRDGEEVYPVLVME